MDTNHHILNAACNLLGISLLIIAGLHISNTAETTLADEIAWIATACFSACCLLSYLSIRSAHGATWESIADKVFLVGLCSLLAAVAILAMSNVHQEAKLGSGIAALEFGALGPRPMSAASDHKPVDAHSHSR